jgi:hypothetical protein
VRGLEGGGAFRLGGGGVEDGLVVESDLADDRTEGGESEVKMERRSDGVGRGLIQEPPSLADALLFC